jgi:hypothetical protein
MAAGFNDFLRWSMGWLPAGPPAVVATGPWRVAAAQVYLAGAQKGQGFMAGQQAGDVFVAGADEGEGSG